MRRGRTNSTFRSDEMIEFSPNLGEDALIGRAPVRPRGRSSSSSINHHSISSKVGAGNWDHHPGDRRFITNFKNQKDVKEVMMEEN